ncbi:MAG: hypothetical protein GY822_06595 [Deltaproteobacteria bacterium]|nr:hypothetical protein [Deltaproteobacteria bacterium]
MNGSCGKENSLTTSSKAKITASLAMFIASVIAIVLLSTGYVDAISHNNANEIFQLEPLVSSDRALSWRELVGLVGAFFLFLVPVVRNFALFRLPQRPLRNWAVASTFVWLALLIWRGGILFS